jgi:heme-degrading monooxygenase HmoA
MISRQWRGLARNDKAADYEKHLRGDTFPALKRIRGFLGASILKRPLGGGVEFLVVTRWESLDAIVKFAGADAEAAVVPPNVQSMMIEFDRRVRHYEVVE